jgi:hypothetical protein
MIMVSLKQKKDRYVTSAIIVVAIAGIFYFGYQAISDVSTNNEQNPFEYNIEHFKKSDSALHHYQQTGQIDPMLERLFAIAIIDDNRLCISGDDKILMLNRNGGLLTTINCGESVRTLAIDTDGNIYAGKQDHIEIYSQEGLLKARWDSLGSKSLITSIAIGDRYVFAADAGNHIVWKYEKSGTLLARIGEKDETRDIPGFIIPSPYFDVAVDPDGFLWVANTGRHSLENYTDEGGLRSTWGEYSMTIEGFCGCCNPTHFAILENGFFVTSEKGIARVKIYNRIGVLVSVVAGPELFSEGVTGLDLAVDRQGRIYVVDPGIKAVRIFGKKVNENDLK